MRGPSLAAVLLSGLAAAVASAHDGGVVDLEAIEAHVAERAAAPGPGRAAYRALDRVLARPVRRPLVDEIAKVRAVEAACRRALAADAALVALLDAATSEVETEVDGQLARTQALFADLERAADRARVARALAKPERDYHAGASKLGAAKLRLFGRAASGLAAAERLAERLLLAEIRRGPPGQTIPKGPSGTIDTYAGTGAPGGGAGGLPARGSRFYFPQDLDADPATGLLHVADLNNHRVWRIDADGRLRAAVGSGVLGDSVGAPLETDLHHPTGVAFDPVSGELYVAGWHAARIVRLDAATGLTAFAAGTGEVGFDGDGGLAVQCVVDYPVTVAFASDGTWYFMDQGNRRVRRVDGTTRIVATVAGTGDAGFAGDDGPAAAAAFDLPSGELAEPAGRICLSPDERFLYVADTRNRRVRRIDLRAAPEPTIETFAGDGTTGVFTAPVDVACAADGTLYVSDRDAATVWRVDAETRAVSRFAGDGVAGSSGDGGPATEARLRAPEGIHVDRLRGRVYVADSGNHVVRVVWE